MLRPGATPARSWAARPRSWAALPVHSPSWGVTQAENRYLGFNDILLHPADGLPAGAIDLADAILATGIVAAAGQRGP